MSEENNPTTPNSSGPSLLEPEERGLSDFIVPGLLGVAGAALLWKFSSKKKVNESKKVTKPDVLDNEIKFSSNYSTYSVGKLWETAVLEPFLAEQAEEGNLITISYIDGGIISSAIKAMVNDSRKKILSAFNSTHKVSTANGEILISKLPSGKSGVQKFNSWLDERVKNFQETY